MNSLKGKAVVIMGGTTGLGYSAAAACLRAGGRVVALGRNLESVEQAASELGDGAVVKVGDARDPTVAEEAIRRCKEQFGSFDGIYHVAGGSGRALGDGALHEITDEGWNSTLDLNLNGLFYSTRAAVRAFLADERGGSILAMGSVLGFSPSPKHFATHAYAATKAAVEGFARSVGSYYAPYGIRVNVLAPGLVETPMARRAAQDERIQEFIRNKQPLDGGRIGRPEDLDAAVVYFLSDDSAFVTGQVLYVDGGWGLSDGVQR